MTCPHCGKELSTEEIKAIWAAYNGSKNSDAKRAASRENGKKGGRPKKKQD